MTTSSRIRTGLRATPYALFHLACLLVVTTDFSWQVVALFLGSYWLRIIGVTLGYHRLFAHKSFKTNRVFQFVLALLGAASLQRDPFWWAWTHRLHHRSADSPDDLHSPKYQGVLYSYWGWIFDDLYSRAPEDAVKDLRVFPELRWLEHWPAWIGVSALYAAIVYWLFGWNGLIWGYFLSTIAIWHSVHWVQVLSHTWGGYRQFDTRDSSRNHLLLGLFTLGEYHNNHHAFAWSAKQGFAWWELDLGYGLLKLLQAGGIVWDIRIPSDRRLNAKRPGQIEKPA